MDPCARMLMAKLLPPSPPAPEVHLPGNREAMTCKWKRLFTPDD